MTVGWLLIEARCLFVLLTGRMFMRPCRSHERGGLLRLALRRGFFGKRWRMRHSFAIRGSAADWAVAWGLAKRSCLARMDVRRFVRR
jgi:hypothetical protein